MTEQELAREPLDYERIHVLACDCVQVRGADVRCRRLRELVSTTFADIERLHITCDAHILVIGDKEAEIARLEQELARLRERCEEDVKALDQGHARAAQLAVALEGAATTLAATGQAMTYQARGLREQAALAARRNPAPGAPPHPDGA